MGSTYHAFTKNEATKVVEHAVAPSATGPYSFVPPGNWGTLVEGPTVVQLPDGVLADLPEPTPRGQVLYSDSADGLVSWSPLREIPGLSGSVRHFGVMREPA